MKVKDLVEVSSTGCTILFYREANHQSYQKYFSRNHKLKEIEANAEVIDIYADGGVMAEAIIKKEG